MKKKLPVVALFLFIGITAIRGQILHTESFSVILDSTQRIKGSIVPDFEFQNQKEDLIEFENTSDISFRLKKSALTLANKIELSKFGDETLLSGGYLYVEFRKIMEKGFTLEPFSQLHWSEARGLEFKYAGGINTRYRIITNDQIGLFAGTGPFYEYERWNYDGVKDNLVPANTNDIIAEEVKLGTYVSFKWETNFNVTLDISMYHQARFDEMFTTPRLASSSSITFNFTEHLGLILQYQNIYDYKPLVPIDKLYNKITFSVDISF